MNIDVKNDQLLKTIFNVPSFFRVEFENALSSCLEEELKKLGTIDEKANYSIVFKKVDDLEGYKVEFKENLLQVSYFSKAYAYYAIADLNLKIALKEDLQDFSFYPKLKIRGVMLDISRNKVYRLDTLKRLVKLFARLKINHLELYVEGFSFEYKSFKELIDINHNYFTLEEFKELESFANEHFIDLVPNQNGLGHMSEWLEQERFKHLAEKEDGIYLWGANRAPSTINPASKDARDLLKVMYQDMLPHFKSEYFNMNLDEPFELGLGKNKELADQVGVGKIYFDHFMFLYNLTKSYHKTPMLWGDVLIRHPELLRDIPHDAIFIDWGYDHNSPFIEHSALLKGAGVRFMNAPGTSTWGSIVGKKIDMEASIDNAVAAAIQNNAEGVLLTDWGDMGHLQYLVFSYPGFIYFGLKASGNYSDEAYEYLLDEYLGKKEKDVILNLSTEYDAEGGWIGYGNRLFQAISWSLHATAYEDSVSYFLERMKNYLVPTPLELKNFLNKNRKALEELNNPAIKQALENSIYLLEILLKINQKLKQLYEGIEINFSDEIEELSNYSRIHQIIWEQEAKPSGYKLSNQKIINLQDVLKKIDERRQYEKNT